MKKDDVILIVGGGLLLSVVAWRFMDRDDGPAAPKETEIAQDPRIKTAAVAIMKRFDQNADERISVKEYPPKKMLFNRMDIDHDGFIDINELSFSADSIFKDKQPHGLRYLLYRDDDEDGVLTENEAPPKEVDFVAADHDKNGVLHPNELCFTRLFPPWLSDEQIKDAKAGKAGKAGKSRKRGKAGKAGKAGKVGKGNKVRDGGKGRKRGKAKWTNDETTPLGQ
jgi:hypothetical protein